MVARIAELFRTYHPIVWWVVGGTILTRLTNFMVMPFMALYMGTHTHASPSTIGLVIGSSAIITMLFGFIGGSLSDRFGRKQLMLIAMGLTVIDMAGYANARSILFFLLLSILSGVSQSLFRPAASALLADVTDADKRGSVFAIQYWAINLAAAVGPILGGYFGTIATGWTFYLAACSSFIYFLVIFLVFPKQSNERVGANPFSIRQTLHVVIADKALLFFLIAGLASNLGYSQIDTNLPQQMVHTVVHPQLAAKLFGFVLASNAIEVVLLQLPLTRLMSHISTVRAMMIGQAIFAVGYMAMGFSFTPWAYFISMFIITVGEIIVFPQNNKYVAELAEDDLRGAYFGSSSMTSLGFFIGPWLGGSVLSHFGGMALFLVVACMVAAGVPFYQLSGNARRRFTTRMTVQPSKTVDL